jgi:hypothetical protein
MAASRGTDAAPAAAAGDACEQREAVPFDEWASVQRRRAALDGAWKVEVSERVVRGNTIRFVTSWHDSVQLPNAPLRRDQKRHNDVPVRQKEQASSSNNPLRQTARQRRSILRSAAHHRLKRLRVLRRLWLVVRFTVRLSRLSATTRALRDGPSPGKRRLSPPPDEWRDHPLRTTSSCSSGSDDDASSPAPKRLEVGRLEWMRQVVSRAVFGNG